MVASPYTVLLAEETVRLIARYLPQAVAHPDDLTARYYLLYASMIAGICFDNGLLHFTHAMEHPLSAVKPELPHGLDWQCCFLQLLSTPILLALKSSLQSIHRLFRLEGVPGEAEECAVGVEKWLFSVGVTEKLEDMGYTANDIDKLVHLAFNTPSLDFLLSMAPIKADERVVRAIFEDSLKPLA